MEKVFLFILSQLVCFAGFCQNPRWVEFGTRIPALTNLSVRWNTPTNFGVGSNLPTNAWPSSMGIYRLVPQRYSPATVSNLMAMCSFAMSDKIKENHEGLVFKSGGRLLTINDQAGSIEYASPEPNYGPTNLAQGVPERREMPELVAKFLRNVGVGSDEIWKDTNGSAELNFWEPYTWFFVEGGMITNTEFRGVVFNRSVENAKVIGMAGSCRLNFGQHKLISKIEFSWPRIERFRTEQTLKPAAIMQMLRQGKAHQGFVPTDFGEIDWYKVSTVTINQAWPCFFAGSTNRLYPFLSIWATIETERGNVDIEIDCPIIDETKS